MALVLKVEPGQPDSSAVRRAADMLRGGGLAIFPTETVYGIGADVRRREAIARLYTVKRRERNLPLMAHCSEASQIAGYVEEIPETARLLMKAFWPGPLALLLRRGRLAPDEATAGLDTVGIRMVAHPVARQLISELGASVAGTSANLHGEPAPNRFDSISSELLAQVDVALDAGRCGDGIPSTVLDVTTNQPRLVREGAVTIQAIEAVLGRPVTRPTRA